MRTEAECLWWWTLLSLRTQYSLLWVLLLPVIGRRRKSSGGSQRHEWTEGAQTQSHTEISKIGYLWSSPPWLNSTVWKNVSSFHFSLIWPFKESKSCIKVWSTLLTPQQHKSTSQQWPAAMYSAADPLHYNPRLGYRSCLNWIFGGASELWGAVWSLHFSHVCMGSLLLFQPVWWTGESVRREGREESPEGKLVFGKEDSKNTEDKRWKGE